MERPFVKNVEEFLNEFIKSADGELVSEKIELQDGVLNCDYFFEKENILAELKCFEKDMFSEEDSERNERLIDKWLNEGFINKSDFIQMFMGKKHLPSECMMELLMLCRRYYETAIKKAHKQVVSTNKLLGNSSTKKVLFLCNDGNYFLSDVHALRTISLILAMNKAWDFDCCVLFTVNQVSRISDNDLDYSFWAPVYKEEESNDGLQEFINDLGEKLHHFYNNKFGITETEHNIYPDKAEGLEAMSKQKHIPKEIIYKK